MMHCGSVIPSVTLLHPSQSHSPNSLFSSGLLPWTVHCTDWYLPVTIPMNWNALMRFSFSLGVLLHHRSAFFYPHKMLFEIHRVFGFFCFRILIFTDFIQSPIIFFGNVTSQIQDRLQIFQVRRPRFSVVTLNEKMCSSPPESGLLFFYAPKANCSPFQFVIFSYPLGMDRIVLCNH
jgi:hypothetical protein